MGETLTAPEDCPHCGGWHGDFATRTLIVPFGAEGCRALADARHRYERPSLWQRITRRVRPWTNRPMERDR